jgi:hypothetical protein
MATVKSTLIGNLDASPVIRNSDETDGGNLRSEKSVATISATIPSADIVHMVRVPTSACVRDILLSAADATTALAADVGLYRQNDDGTYTAVDVDFFASAYDFTAGPITNLSVLNESTTNTPTKQTQPLWLAAAGLAADPGGYYVVSLTITTTGNGGPTTVALEAQFVQ